jgi:nicotinamidase/pyrazinamidase
MIAPAGTALIAVDVQFDFLPGGALGVPGADVVVAPIRELATYVGVVVATRDFHPPSHCSFTAQGGPWPPHCVIATPGAALHPDIDAIAHAIVSKGTAPSLEQYSGFDGTGLAALLQARGVRQVIRRRHCHRLLRPGHRASSMRRGLRHDSCARRGARREPSSRRRRSSPG